MHFPGSERREKPAAGARCSSAMFTPNPKASPLYLTRPNYPLAAQLKPADQGL